MQENKPYEKITDPHDPQSEVAKRNAQQKSEKQESIKITDPHDPASEIAKRISNQRGRSNDDRENDMVRGLYTSEVQEERAKAQKLLGLQADAAYVPEASIKYKQAKGYIHVYSGDGKGKTTAATGLAVRAASRQWRVLFVQFIKSGKSAELNVLRALPTVKVVSGQKISKFTFAMTDEEKAIAKDQMESRLRNAIAEAPYYDMLVLDEALGAISAGLIPEEEVLRLMKNKPEHLELVLTGRNPSEEIAGNADYHSEVCMRKHPYETEGLTSRPGVEF